MEDFSGDVLRTVGRHFVSLSCNRRQANGERDTWVFSGFLVDIHGHWFYVTAGHILRDIRACVARGDSFDVWRLSDQSAGNQFNGVGIPFEFEDEYWLVIEDEAAGLDYAAIPLREMYVRNLDAGGAMALGADSWGDQLTDHDQMALIGIPKETVSYHANNLIKGRMLLIPLAMCDAPPASGRKADNQFFARFKKDPTGFVENINGMSGGPVFALKLGDDGNWRYKVIGVQSGWYDKLLVIAACPFSSLGEALQGIVEEVHAMQCTDGEASTG